MTETPNREELVDRLPTPSPLSGDLEALVAATDRTATATEFGLDYRASDGVVRVSIELEADGELPDGYPIEEISRVQNQVEAYVPVDDLVPVAMHEAVRKIQPPPDSRAH